LKALLAPLVLRSHSPPADPEACFVSRSKQLAFTRLLLLVVRLLDCICVEAPTDPLGYLQLLAIELTAGSPPYFVRRYPQNTLSPTNSVPIISLFSKITEHNYGAASFEITHHAGYLQFRRYTDQHVDLI
jgi:hypothetical protein